MVSKEKKKKLEQRLNGDDKPKTFVNNHSDSTKNDDNDDQWIALFSSDGLNPSPPTNPRSVKYCLEEFPLRENFWSLVLKDEFVDPSSIPSIKSIYDDCKEFESEHFLNRIRKMGDLRNKIERLTKGQSDNLYWLEYRKMTITGSKAHLIYNAARSGILSSKIKKLITGENESELNFPPVVWGREKETVARWDFIKRKKSELPNFKFENRGLFVDKMNPFIGASVDGLYLFGGEDPDISDPEVRILEIKCPYSIKSIGVQKGASQLRYLEGKYPNVSLKKWGPYYTQIQLYLGVYELETCTLLIWTPIDFIEIDVKRDRQFIEDLFAKFEHFYTDLFVPALLGNA